MATLEWDDDGARWTALPAPRCTCGASLTRMGDPGDRRVSLDHARWGETTVLCDDCNKRYAIIGDRVEV